LNRTAVPPPVTMVLDAADAWLPMRMEAVEERLRLLVEGHGDDLAADAGATLAAGGKRLRPMLVLLCAGPGAGEPAVRAAAAIELVHMATLVHDDVLDAAPLRRGRPTVVAQSGRDRALAVGDLLFSRAFAELGHDGSERQVELLSGASVALALGELAQRRDAFDISISAERYLDRCGLKTARLFECACLLGAGAVTYLARLGHSARLPRRLHFSRRSLNAIRVIPSRLPAPGVESAAVLRRRRAAAVLRPPRRPR